MDYAVWICLLVMGGVQWLAIKLTERAVGKLEALHHEDVTQLTMRIRALELGHINDGK